VAFKIARFDIIDYRKWGILQEKMYR